MRDVSALAVNGGRPAVVTEHPAPWPFVSRTARARVAELLDAGELSDYALGATLAEFEHTVSAYQGTAFALNATSGTAALHMAFFAVGVRPGDEVIVPSYSFHASLAPLLLLSAVPVLCDVDPATGNVDLADAESRITQRTRAIVVTHMWGHPVEMNTLTAMTRKYGIQIVEDCSHAHGARYRGRLVGTFGEAAVFSLGARKMVSGGMGGVLVTADEEVFQSALRLGHCHERAELTLPAADVAVGYGANYRMSVLAAAICIDQYRDLDVRIARKTEVLEGLSRRLDGIAGIRPQYTVRHVTRGGWYGYKAEYHPEELGGCPLDVFIAGLQAEGLRVARPSNRPLHWQRMFGGDMVWPEYYRPGVPVRTYKKGELAGAEKYYEASLSFPASYLHEPADALLDQYAEGLRKVVGHIDDLI